MDFSALGDDGKVLDLLFSTAIAKKRESKSAVEAVGEIAELMKKLGPEGIAALTTLLASKKETKPKIERREYREGKRHFVVWTHPDGTTETTSFPIPIWEQ